MMDGSEVLLHCFPWAHDGEADGLSAYEDRVIALLPVTVPRSSSALARTEIFPVALRCAQRH
jgi:hypothetical protein